MNTKNLLAVAAIVLGAAVTFADAAAPKAPAKAAQKKAEAEDMSESIYRHFGEDLKDVRKQKGKLVIVNCQKSAKTEWMKSAAGQIDGDVRIAIEVADGAFDLKKPVVQGEASIFIVDDPTLPMTLVAPEAKWAMVNIATFKTDKGKFYEMRTRKAIVRTFAYLCGGMGSQFKMTLAENITKAEDYDNYAADKLPFDLLQRLPKYLKTMGITPYTMSCYRQACQEGWAASPTNEVQKAIWDEIHALPDKPIKIKKQK